MDWWNILVLGVISVLTVVIIFVAKRKLLWIAPFISTALAFITYMIALSVQGIHTYWNERRSEYNKFWFVGLTLFDENLPPSFRRREVLLCPKTTN